MIGNDVVDLELAKVQSNWRRPGYLQKIFTKEECQQILNSKDKDRTLWLFWTMKEAAYKAWQRSNNLPPRFNPGSLSCILHTISSDMATGEVIIKEHKESYITRSNLNSSVITSLATNLDNEKVIWKNITSKENLRQTLIKELETSDGPFCAPVEIKKDKNLIPQIYLGGQSKNHCFSLSYHGRFSGFALALNNS
ncbi:4'-phosphopantetheinyl transferase family protein [Salegentibacter sp. F14]